MNGSIGSGWTGGRSGAGSENNSPRCGCCCFSGELLVSYCLIYIIIKMEPKLLSLDAAATKTEQLYRVQERDSLTGIAFKFSMK